ncbi:MAG: carbon-nitrogen hydrolase family protein [Colwellia sp.]|nr:carbon-nitrogen hydrolase family protein [Colwellia sp.]
MVKLSAIKLSAIKLSAIQLNAKPNVDENIQAIAKHLAQITAGNSHDQHLVVLPECCLFFGSNDQAQLQLAKESKPLKGDLLSLLQQMLSELAKQYGVYLVAGTVPLINNQAADHHDKFTNTSCIFNPEGKMLASYDKIHLFDASINDTAKTVTAKSYDESCYTQAGNKLCVVKTPLATIGLTVCFDIRFPVLYQKLNALGADIITVPSAFTRVTGKAHWQTLLQARAIENQVYIIAAGQEGVHDNGRETWGHSMIISPWGEILSCLEEGEGYISTTFLPKEINRIRAAMPLNSPLT